MKIRKIIVSMAIIATVLMSLVSMKTYAAAGSFSASANNTTLEVNGTATLTVSATECAGQFSISSSDASVATVSGSSAFLDSSSQTFTITAKKAGTAKITVTAADVTDTSENAVTGSKSVTITVKAKEEPAQQNQNNNNNNNNNNNQQQQQQQQQQQTPAEPKFTNTSSTMYTTSDCNLRSSWSTSSAATWVKKGTQVTVTGTSTEKVNGYVWYRVNYNGTKYIASFLLTPTKPADDEEQKKQEEEAKKKAEEEAKKKAEEEANATNKALKSLDVEGYKLSPAFTPENTKYSLELNEGDDVQELKINAVPADEKAQVVIEGNKDFTVGNKIVKITVTAQDKTTRLYTISVTKPGETAQVDDLKLSSLKVANATLTPAFDPDVKNYTIETSDPSSVKEEDISVITEDEKAKATIAIKDNSDGSKLITILLESTDENDSRTGVYQINVRKPVAIEEVAEKGKVDKKIYIIFGSIIAVLIILIIAVIIALRKTSDDDDDDDDDFDDDDIDDDGYIGDNSRNAAPNNAPKFDQSLKDAIDEANGIYDYDKDVDIAPKSQILSKKIPNEPMDETQLFDSDKFREVSDDNSKRRGKHF